MSFVHFYILLFNSRAAFSDIHSMAVLQDIVHISFITQPNVEGRKSTPNTTHRMQSRDQDEYIILLTK